MQLFEGRTLMNNTIQSRRDMIRKTALFAVPTIASFKLSELTVKASGIRPDLKKKTNNGNHYGNSTPDYNPTDWKNQFNTSQTAATRPLLKRW